MPLIPEETARKRGDETEGIAKRQLLRAHYPFRRAGPRL